LVKLNTRTWARGVTTTYLYDAAGQTEGIDYSDSTPDVAMEYDHLEKEKMPRKKRCQAYSCR